jgi:hypothetical protein
MAASCGSNRQQLSPQSKPAQVFVSEFWNRRWQRYWGFAWPWLIAAFAPLIGLLILGLASICVADGFAKPNR